MQELAPLFAERYRKPVAVASQGQSLSHSG